MELYVMSGNTEVAVYCDRELTIMNDALVPLFLKRTGNFEKWVADRAIDSVRPNSRVLKKVHGLSRMASDYETSMLYNAACITDNFWVRSGDETWEEIRFDSDVYFRAALDSDNGAFGIEPSRTPELTNTGSREKGWRLTDGTWWLYKNEPKQNETFELLTYQIGCILGFDMAYYELSDGYIRTRDVTMGKLNLQHIDAVMFDHEGVTDDDVAYNYDTLRAMDPDLARQYKDIKYLDALVNNVDRHTKNYAFLTSQEDGHIVSLAPNYDNDMAFYGWPEILDKPRHIGEISALLKAAGSIEYTPAEIDRSRMQELLRNYDSGDKILHYLLEGEELLLSALKRK